MTEKRLNFLSSGNGRIKNLLMELFLLVNMAQLMYVAALSFYKILIVSEGISIAQICMYRFGILLTFESLKWACCGPCFTDSSSNQYNPRDSSPRANEGMEVILDGTQQQRNNWMLVTIVYCLQAFLTTVAILTVLIAVKALPLCYVMLGLNLTNLLFTTVFSLENQRIRDTSTIVGLILVLVTVACAFSSVRILGEPETIAKKLKEASDPIIQMIQNTTSETFESSSEFIIGLFSTITSGFCFSMSYSLNKSKLIASESSEQ